MQAELSEVQVASGGGATATVIWSEGYNGGVARPVGQIISIDPAIVSAGAGYLLLGEVQYAYQPLNIWQSVGAFTISDSIFMAPRSAAQITINWGYYPRGRSSRRRPRDSSEVLLLPRRPCPRAAVLFARA